MRTQAMHLLKLCVVAWFWICWWFDVEIQARPLTKVHTISLSRNHGSLSSFSGTNENSHIMNSHRITSYLQMKYPAEIIMESETEIAESTGVELLPMTNVIKNGYTSTVYIGTPKQVLNWIFDTGSSVMFINSLLWNLGNCQKNPQYDPEKSSTSQISDSLEKHDVLLNYGSGFLQGEILTDSVWINNLEVPDQEIAQVKMEDQYSTDNFSCLIGLAFPSLAPNEEKLLFDNIMENDVLSENVFTAYYYKDGEHAELVFGEIDSKYYSEPLDYHPVTEEKYWNITIDDFKINGVSLNLCPHGCNGIIDTGTNVNTFEETEFSQISKAIGTKLWDDVGAMPTMTYVIGGIDYTFTGEEYTMPTEDSHEDKWEFTFFQMKVLKGPHNPVMVIGTIFMQKYFTVFDRDFSQVGFALAKDLSYDGDQ